MKQFSIVMMGATGAVGGHVHSCLATMPNIEKLTLLNRRTVGSLSAAFIHEEIVDVLSVKSYVHLLAGHNTAICTLGVGQPSQMSKEEFLQIDRDAVLDFGKACKAADVEHFELLSSVGANASSPSFYLRTKGELQEGLKALGFKRLSLFEPSMILTPTNRYGISQLITLKLTPLINPFLIGGLTKFRGIAVKRLGVAMARNVVAQESVASVEKLHWEDFNRFNA